MKTTRFLIGALLAAMFWLEWKALDLVYWLGEHASQFGKATR